MNSASTITQKWEQDARKDPEEEYFRLVSDSLTQVVLLSYSDSVALHYVELLGFENHLQRAGHRLRVYSGTWETLC